MVGCERTEWATLRMGSIIGTGWSGCSEEVAEDKCAGRENSLDTGPEVGRAWALSFWPEACLAMEHELGTGSAS